MEIFLKEKTFYARLGKYDCIIKSSAVRDGRVYHCKVEGIVIARKEILDDAKTAVIRHVLLKKDCGTKIKRKIIKKTTTLLIKELADYGAYIAYERNNISSIYIKFKNKSMPFIRISDHNSRKQCLARWNVNIKSTSKTVKKVVKFDIDTFYYPVDKAEIRKMIRSIRLYYIEHIRHGKEQQKLSFNNKIRIIIMNIRIFYIVSKRIAKTQGIISMTHRRLKWLFGNQDKTTL